MAQKRHGWHREDIKAELRKKFGPISDLSEAWDLDRSAIASALRRPNNSKRVERLISNALQVPLHELWPDRWSPTGEPLPRFDAAENRQAAESAHRQKREAA
jgi:Ner family transcriptional regulator